MKAAHKPQLITFVTTPWPEMSSRGMGVSPMHELSIGQTPDATHRTPL
jgi:hypothetical protein